MFKYAIRETIWIKRFINKILFEKTIKSLILYRDNEIDIIITNNIKIKNYRKYIDV